MQRRVSLSAFLGSLKLYMVVRGRIHEQRELSRQVWTLTCSLWVYVGLPHRPCVATRTCHGNETHVITISAQEAYQRYRRKR